jgi:hypothetical protein
MNIPNVRDFAAVRDALLEARGLCEQEPWSEEETRFLSNLHETLPRFAEIYRTQLNIVSNEEYDELYRLRNLVLKINQHPALKRAAMMHSPSDVRWGGALITDGNGPTAYARKQSPTTSERK